MANDAKRDPNFVTARIAVLNSDGVTVVRLAANPSTHALSVSDGTTGSNLGPANALRDGNGVPTLLATSSSNGRTPIAAYCDSTGKLLIKST